MKIHIIYEFKDSAWGGGNQFLKALREQFKELGCYVNDPKDANAIIFNSHHQIDRVMQLKNSLKNKIFVHRLDGPMRLYNSSSDTRDILAYNACNKCADAVIFQSEFSKRENIRLGLINNIPSAVILNAPDNRIFTPRQKKSIVSASFSPNIKKGFLLYEELDKNLDFNKFEYTFFGESPISFSNIKLGGTLPSIELASKFRQSDIYITASINDPCSNSLLEAIACGAYPFALNSGGHPEIINRYGGKLFENAEDLIKQLDNYISGTSVKLPDISKTALEYLEFIGHVYEHTKYNQK